MQRTIEYKDKLSQWREKAKERRKEKEYLGQRLEEVKVGREKWKAKYKLQKASNKALEKELKKLKRFSRSNSDKDLGDSKPRYHSYSTWLIGFCIMMRQKGNVSLRGCQEILKIVSLLFNLNLQIPTKTSIQNWEKKSGYYQLKSEFNTSGNWALILDESISIGQHKLLLILGVNLSEYNFRSTLNFSDTKLLFMGISKSWKGEQIAEKIASIKVVNPNIVYGISDGGTNLVKALKMSEIDRVEDCTHAIGNLLKKQYNNDEIFQKFSKECGVFKRQVMLGQYAVYAPPKQRVKGRFLNVRELAKWAYQMLQLLSASDEVLEEPIRKKLQWLKSYESLIIELYDQCLVMDKIFKILKTKGLDNTTKKECLQVLKNSKCVAFFKQGVREYLTKNIVFQKGEIPLICCSDIIESYFGKYKNQVAKNGSSLITDACLCMGNYGLNFDELQIKKAMEEVKIVDLKKWKNQNITSSFKNDKKNIFKNTG